MRDAKCLRAAKVPVAALRNNVDDVPAGAQLLADIVAVPEEQVALNEDEAPLGERHFEAVEMK